MLRAVALWILFLAIYLLLAGSLSAAELLAGAVVAAGVAAYAHLYLRAEERQFALGALWLAVFPRAFAAVPRDALRVGGMLMTSLWQPRMASLGAPARQPFVPGSDTPQDAARRALVVLGASLAPNGFVLMIPEGSGVMVMHRLAVVPPHPDPEWPV